jgi:hypothetical protein
MLARPDDVVAIQFLAVHNAACIRLPRPVQASVKLVILNTGLLASFEDRFDDCLNVLLAPELVRGQTIPGKSPFRNHALHLCWPSGDAVIRKPLAPIHVQPWFRVIWQDVSEVHDLRCATVLVATPARFIGLGFPRIGNALITTPANDRFVPLVHSRPSENEKFAHQSRRTVAPVPCSKIRKMSRNEVEGVRSV